MQMLRSALAGLLALLTVAPAAAQVNMNNLPTHTVVGRLATTTGPAQAIPFETLAAQMRQFSSSVLTVTSNYTITTSDCGNTVAAGTGTTGFFIVTLPAVAGFPDTCAVTLVNADTERAKLLSGFPEGLNSFYLYQGQTLRVGIINGVWTYLATPGRYKIPAGTFNLYYDPAAGNDLNDGLAAGAGNAMQTLNGVASRALNDLDWSGNSSGPALVILNQAAGTTETAGLHWSPHALVGAQGGASLKIKGGSNSIIQTTGVDAIATYFGSVLELDNLIIRSTLNGVNALWGSKVYMSNITFGGGGFTPAGGHIVVSEGAQIEQSGAIAFAGNAAYGIINSGGYYRTVAQAVAFSADAAFSGAFLLAVGPGDTNFGSTTISLNAHVVTGVRFTVSNSAHVATGPGTGSLTYFPGSVAGSVTSGATYDTVMTQTAAQGGTGFQSYAVGDILYADTTTTLAKLADIATGNALISGGVGAAPSYGKIGISTHVSGLGTGVATALGNNTNSSGGFPTQPVGNSSLANSATTVAGQTCTLGSTCGLSTASNTISGDVNLNNTANYFDGPSTSQGSTGTWWASGSVQVTGNTNDTIICKLWDGTTVISSGGYLQTAGAASAQIPMSLSGFIASPAGNIRISCRDVTSTSGVIKRSDGINNNASSLYVVRIN